MLNLSRFIVFLLLAWPILVRADFDSAVKAYRERHYAAAYREFLSMAKAGNARAQTIIAMMNRDGESVTPDARKAFSWYMKAARQDYGPAMYQVGTMYADGKGIAADRDKAIYWLRKAAEAGVKRAAGKLTALNANLPAQPAPAMADGKPRPWNFRVPNHIQAMDGPLKKLDPEANYRVELGSMKTREGAGRLWDALTRLAPDVMKNAEPIIELAEHSDRRLYRVQTGPFDGLAAARRFCEQLQRRVRTTCQPVAI